MTKFQIPETALAQHIAVLGKTGSGKTSTAKLIIEHVVAEDYRVCILDPIKSDWWGITSSADGKRAGLPFTILGGPRGHVPLHATSGKVLAELVANGKLPHSILDMANFRPGEHQKFFAEFAETLMRKMRGVVYLVLEEAHFFAPKERAGIEGENMAIYWAKMIATAGRTKGIRFVMATQRTQALHNALLGSCDTMIVHRFTAPADQEPVQKWLKANVKDKDVVARIHEGMSSLPTGTGWLCSGEAKAFELIQFPRIKTFDNTATPDKDGNAYDVKTAPVDKDKLRSIIGDAAVEAEANDPAALKKKIAGLADPARLGTWFSADNRAPAVSAFPAGPERDVAVMLEQAIASIEAEEINIGPQPAEPVDPQAEARAYWRGRAEAAADFDQPVKSIIEGTVAVKQFSDRLDAIVREHLPELDRLASAKTTLADLPPAPSVRLAPIQAPVAERRAPRSYRSTGSGAGSSPAGGAISEGLSRPQQAILDALAWLDSIGITSADRPRAAFLANQSHKSSGFEKNCSTLKTKGLIDYPAPGALGLTGDGRANANRPQRAPTTDDLHAAIRDHVSGPQWALLEALCSVYPRSLSRDELARRAGVSAASSGFEKNVSTMRSFGFVDYPDKGHVVATPLMFVSGR